MQSYIVVLRIISDFDPATWDWPTLLDEDPDNVGLLAVAEEAKGEE